MLVQQKWTMPPPTDEQQEQQQKMMKYMMVFMGLMFYKVASGLCIYFIASSVWGFCERQLLPKKKPGAVPEPPPDEQAAGLVCAAAQRQAGPTATAVTTGLADKADNPSLRIFSGEQRGGKGKRGKAPAGQDARQGRRRRRPATVR